MLIQPASVALSAPARHKTCPVAQWL